MLRHIVMFKLKNEAEGATKQENAVKIKTMLDRLPALIPEIKYYEVGINQTDSERAFDICLISHFENWKTLESYRNHPEHIKAVEFILKVNERSAVADYEV